jgi:hypothetical protein
MRMKIHFLDAVVFDREIDPNDLPQLANRPTVEMDPTDRFLHQWHQIATSFDVQAVVSKIGDQRIEMTGTDLEIDTVIMEQIIGLADQTGVSIVWKLIQPSVLELFN